MSIVPVAQVTPGMDYSDVHDRGTQTCDDLDTLAGEVRDGRADNLTEPCLYVLLDGCHPELFHAVRGLAWYYIVFESLVAAAIVIAVGFACTHPKVISETLQI